MTREMSVSGAFYPSSSKEIEKMFEHFNKIVDAHITDKNLLSIEPKSIISPHAGYIYSAFSANIAFRVLKNTKPKRVVVVGPSHKVYIEGSSIGIYESFDTPFGKLKMDLDLSNELKSNFGLSFVPNAHKEHSTEVQMPFIKYYLKDVKVVEIVYGKTTPQAIKQMIDFCLNKGNTAIVISTDLSHYHDLKKANMLDNICLEAVAKLETALLYKGCEACGILGIEAMIESAKDNSLKPILLDYRTSADASGDESAVVGYMSAAFVG